MMKPNKTKSEINRELYKKKHLAFHHSPNRICVKCIDIGYNKSLTDFAEKIKKEIFNKRYLEDRKIGNGTGRFYEKLKGEVDKILLEMK